MDQVEAETQARDGYDRMAEVYRDHVVKETSVSSLAMAGIEYFAHLVQQSGDGLVADVGCGPGHITAHLADLGLNIFGIDISPALLELARDAHPDIRFELGELASLPVQTSSLQAIVSRHSLIHTPAELVPAALCEFARALTPGGLLCLSFFAAPRPDAHGVPFDHAVTTAFQLDVDAIVALMAAVGLVEQVRIVRQPRESERQLPHAMLYAVRQ